MRARIPARIVIGLILVAAQTCALGQGAAGAQPPNVVLVVADDLGYADIYPFGAKAYATPNLDRMAREGRTFRDFYVAQAVCSASRAALLTGCYNVRIGIQGALSHTATFGISSSETTLAELLKSQGYATACFGKWHLGHHPKFLPINHGFDEYFGLPYSNDMWPNHPTAGKNYPDLPLLEGDRVINPRVTSNEQSQLTKWYTERAVRFIEQNRGRPFFLYVPHTMVHVPLHVSDAYRDKTNAGLYADAVAEVDWSVGEIMAAIKARQLDTNTLVIFTSDNGPWLGYGRQAGSAGPLREGKFTTFEGGCRVPMIAWWPGKIPAGSVCREPAMTIDILPTIAELTGSQLPRHPIDGKSIWPLMQGVEGAKSPQQAYFFYWGRELQAVRMGRWKLHFPHEYDTLEMRANPRSEEPILYQIASIDLSLYDLQSDSAESINVLKDHPDVVAQIEQLAEQERTELGDSATKQQGLGVREPGRLSASDRRFHWQPGKPLDEEAK